MSINQGTNTLHASGQQSILKIVVNTPLRKSFDYLPPADYQNPIQTGIRVRVPFGKRELIGLVTAIASDSELQPGELKSVLEVIDETPLIDEGMQKFLGWAAAYYHHPLGQVIHNALPTRVRQGKSIDTPASPKVVNAAGEAKLDLQLNPEQKTALQSILDKAEAYHCFLLEGVTGSGKTEVYLQLIAEKLHAKKQVLMLVPEISLTPQTLQRFQDRFTQYQIVSLHSGLTDKQRYEAWIAARNGDADIIIGTRSAVFVPLKRPGLIIVDEEHDGSYKQQDGFRYSARDLAVFRAQQMDTPVVLGSATPSLESLNNAISGRYTLLTLKQRAAAASQPSFKCIDLKGKKLVEGFSEELLEAITYHLDKGQQVLVFLNRRGFAPLLQCHDCGWNASCPRCDISYTLHRSKPELRCHRCESQTRLPLQCPHCQSKNLYAIGMGTERTEDILEKKFPAVPVYRIDRDTTRKRQQLEQTLSNINRGEPAILVGTQMLAKGHHFPKVTLVAILDADSGLFSSDFRGQEFMGQLLIQVAGRAGREQDPGEVMIQTHNSTHPSLLSLIRDGYEIFARQLIEQRKLGRLPPFTYQVLLRAEANKAAEAEKLLHNIRQASQAFLDDRILAIGPLPAPMEKRAGRFRFQLLLQSDKRADLHNMLRQLLPVYESLPQSRRVRWALDIDPLDFS